MDVENQSPTTTMQVECLTMDSATSIQDIVEQTKRRYTYNNNNKQICNAHKIKSSMLESEAQALTSWPDSVH